MGGQHPAAYFRSPLAWTDRMVTRERDGRSKDGRRSRVAKRAPLPRMESLTADLEIDRSLPGKAFKDLVLLAQGDKRYKGITAKDRRKAVEEVYRIVRKRVPGFTVQDANATLTLENIPVRLMVTKVVEG